MDRIRIRGGRPLRGAIPIGGAKNAALPLMAAALLTDGPLVLTNAPALEDVRTMRHLLAHHGLEAAHDTAARTLTLSGTATCLEAPYDLVRRMRASVLVLGPLLARFGEAKVSLPGGCAIGTRPVDLHLKGLEAMGAKIDLEAGYIDAQTAEWSNFLLRSTFSDIAGARMGVREAFSVLDLCQRWCVEHVGCRLRSLSFMFTSGLYESK